MIRSQHLLNEWAVNIIFVMCTVFSQFTSCGGNNHI